MLTKLCLLLAIFIHSAHGQSKQIYALEDLEVLANEKSFSEFFIHAKDVVPSKRSSKWKSLVSTMSSSYLNRLMVVEITPMEFETTQQISKWASLKEDEFFIEKYSKVAVRYFDQCFKLRGKLCGPIVNKFVKTNTINKKLGVELANLMYINGIQKDLYPLIRPMAQDTLGEFYCGKMPTSQIILDDIYRSSGEIAKIHSDCLKTLKPLIVTSLTKANSPLARYTSYTILEKSGTLSPLQKSVYLTGQLISSFTLDSSQTLQAFNELKKLSESAAQRERVMNQLKEMVPLPGKVFKLRTKSSYAIISGLLRYMPEYLDFYATTCIDHLSGKKSTIGGNPATECHEFFELSKLMKIIPESKRASYDKIMKL